MENSIKPKPKRLNTEQAAEFIGVSAGTLPVWRCNGRYRLPYVKVGRKVFYLEDDLIEWLERRKVNRNEPESAYA